MGLGFGLGLGLGLCLGLGRSAQASSSVRHLWVKHSSHFSLDSYSESFEQNSLYEIKIGHLSEMIAVNSSEAFSRLLRWRSRGRNQDLVEGGPTPLELVKQFKV